MTLRKRTKRKPSSSDGVRRNARDKEERRISTFRFLFISCIAIFSLRIFFKPVLLESTTISKIAPTSDALRTNDVRVAISAKKQRPPQQCTRDELLKVRNQINPEACPSALTQPWTQL
jgi:hypothetical protein